MSAQAALVDWAPALRLALLAAAIAAPPLAWVWLRRSGGQAGGRLAALTALTLFLTFDLIVFGAYTRLSDSGLGCPDWPGCYGAASPLGARDEIAAAHAAAPGGPVSWSKAWVEMVHRYLAMTVGALIVVGAVAAWLQRRRLPGSPWWPTATLAWVIVQGLFGRYTVTLKLHPAVVTLHLIGGIALLMLLAWQHAAWRNQPLALAVALRRLAQMALALLLVQVALGAWVSSNYAVLACTGFPRCNGLWWPPMDFGAAFLDPLRHLGEAGLPGSSTLDRLTAIHMAHRLFALAAGGALALAAWRLARVPAARRFGVMLAALLAAQFATGWSNVVFGWPLAAALLHSAGAAAMVGVLSLLLARSAPLRRGAAVALPTPARQPA